MGDGTVTRGGGDRRDRGHRTGVASVGHGGDASSLPMVRYLVSWSVDTTAAQIGSLNGLCAAPGSTAQLPIFGFEYHLVGTDPTGAIVDDRFACIAFPNGDATQRPPAPAGPRGADAR